MAVEGGAFRCDIHVDKDGNGFSTSKIEEYNHHCLTTEGHREEGQTFCPGCNTLIEFSIPFMPLDNTGSKGMGPIRCDDCAADNEGNDIQTQKVEQIQAQAKVKQGAKKK
jgi:hypothetical protein